MEGDRTGEVMSSDEPKKRRRSKWDAPAPATDSGGTDGGVLSSSVVAAGALLTKQQAAEKAFAQQALAQTMMVRAAQPIFSPAMISTAVAPAASKLDCRIYIGCVSPPFPENNIFIVSPSITVPNH